MINARIVMICIRDRAYIATIYYSNTLLKIIRSLAHYLSTLVFNKDCYIYDNYKKLFVNNSL